MVRGRDWLAMATREGLLCLDLDFIKHREEISETKRVIQKTFPVIDKGAYWEVRVSPCCFFLVALESHERIILVDCVTK